jgi:hypothetical protein
MKKRFLFAAFILTVSFYAQAGADTSSSGGGNQLMKNQTHWYQAAATLVGPAEGLSDKGGTLLTLQAGSFVYIVGGSTLHDYQMNAHSLKGSAVLKGSAADLVKALKTGEVSSMRLVVPITTFKSRESGLDDNAAKALQSKENPEIRFDLTKEKLAAGTATGAYVMTATGTLTIAGETAPVTLTADVTVTDKQIHFKGVQKLKMTDFKITPPSISLLVTSITCTDEISVYYDVIFAAK